MYEVVVYVLYCASSAGSTLPVMLDSVEIKSLNNKTNFFGTNLDAIPREKAFPEPHL